jgi:hypothetical protein
MNATTQWRIGIVGLTVAAAIIVMALQQPIAQPIDYHQFADAKTIFVIPNFWNVVSNIPFLIVGLLGLYEVLMGKGKGGLPNLKWLYATFFFFVGCACFGSIYYHLSPSHATLAWDRVPIASAILAFLTIIVGEHINESLARKLLVPLLVLGAWSVWYWHHTEQLGQGDLRAYLLVQFLSILVIAMILMLFPSKLSGTGYVWAMFASYAIAKVLEELDTPLYTLTDGFISGHPLKHVVAALGMGFFVIALRKRRRKE